MKFFYGLSVGILLAGETFAEKCETGHHFNLTANKCMEDGCLGPESCMDPATLGEYVVLKKPAEFAVKCIKTEACECDAFRGYVQSDKTNKFSICTPPTKKCTDTTGKYEEYECGENYCTCKTKNFDYCAIPDNDCHKQGNTCESVVYDNSENFEDHKCGVAPENMIVDRSTNEYVCGPGTKLNSESKCQHIVTCESNSCKNNQECSVNDFKITCDCKSGFKNNAKKVCQKLKTCKTCRNNEKCSAITEFKNTGCKCIVGHIKIKGKCVLHTKTCDDDSCSDTQGCFNGTVTSNFRCKNNCKIEAFYTNQNQTCEATSGKIGCVEGFEISSVEPAEISCTPEPLAETNIVERGPMVEEPIGGKSMNQGTLIYLVIAVVAALAIVMGVIMFLKSRKSGGYTGGANTGGGEE